MRISPTYEKGATSGVRTALRRVIRPTPLMAVVAFVVVALLVSCDSREPLRPQSPSIPSDASVPATTTPDGDQRTAAPDTPSPRKTVPAAECPGDNERRGWYYTPASVAKAVPAIPDDVEGMLGEYGVLWRVPTTDKVVYLTFDQGYEAGYTGRILDVLAAEGVRATFFVTRSYIEAQPDLIRRMVAEGHVVANHSDTHPSMVSLADDREGFERELGRCAEAYRELTGRQMPSLFRPPMGDYSPRTLCMTRELGYTSVFWSFAHRDWLLDDQPAVDVTVRRVVGGTHPGVILLLHAVSSSNTEALPEIVRTLRSEGYRFGSLGEVE